MHDSITPVSYKISSNFAMSSLLLTSFDCSNRVLFSWAEKYLNFPSSIFFRMKPRAQLCFATHFSLSRTRSNFSSITWAVRLLTTRLNPQYLSFCISESTRKCLHDCNSSLKLWSSISPTMSSTLKLLAPNPICVPCWVFLCWRKA